MFAENPDKMSKSFNLLSQTLRILCAVALLSVGFAHKPPVIPVAQVVSEVLPLPDGTLPSLCLPGVIADDSKGTMVHGTCDACIIASAILVPTPVAHSGERLLPAGEIIRPDRARFDASPVLMANAAPRAPPFT